MDATKPLYQELVNHYEQCLERHGATPQGVDWPNPQDLTTRFKVMLDVCQVVSPDKTIDLLDLGCGYGALLEYINNSGYHQRVNYRGIDLSAKMIQAAIDKFGASYFEQRDILVNKLPSASVDFIVMNGLFTEKRSLSQAEMELFFANMLTVAFDAARVAVAFNVMNYHVDWFRDDLFHLPFDRMAEIVKQCCSRHFTIRADYGLYEYTAYVYKQPNVSLS